MDNVTLVDLDGDGFLSDVDCDDNNAMINPDAVEICNSIDDNCDGQVDEGLVVTRFYQDQDGDGYGIAGVSVVDCRQPAGFATLFGDCDDMNSSIHPGQTEAPYNGIDDDCDPGTADDDVDADGYLAADDCDDNNNQVNPGQTEIPYNALDDDCDVSTLDDDLDQDGFVLADDCDDNNSAINPNQIEIVYNGVDEDCNPLTPDDDLDQDGFVLADDCDDNNSSINPSQTEIPYNNQDDDCNPATFDDDLDQDGFVLEDDCDDENEAINPAAEEIPNNGIDENCDGMDLISDIHEFSTASINIFPNPVRDILFISVKGELNYESTLYSMDGKVLIKTLNSNQMNLESLASGTYLLTIRDVNSNQRTIEKIVVQK